jgi:hypothetical protein
MLAKTKVAAELALLDTAAVPKGVTICNVFGHEQPMAEYVIMTMLALTHRLFEEVTTFRAGSWSASPQFGDGFSHGEVHNRDHRLWPDGARSGGTRGGAQMPRPRRQPQSGRRSRAGGAVSNYGTIVSSFAATRCFKRACRLGASMPCASKASAAAIRQAKWPGSLKL